MSRGARALLLSLGFVLALGASCFLIANEGRRAYASLTPKDSPKGRCAGRTSFDPTVWQDSVVSESTPALRGCMVDDLLRSDRLKDLDRPAVVALLGEPRQTSYFRGTDLVYWLGPERGALAIDSEWLLINLDHVGRVEEVRLATD